VQTIHERRKDPPRLAALYHNVYFCQFKNTLEAQKSELRPLEVNIQWSSEYEIQCVGTWTLAESGRYTLMIKGFGLNSVGTFHGKLPQVTKSLSK
jgi:hypothetical protein